MTPDEAITAAKAILLKRAGENEFRVMVDSPMDCTRTIAAFKKLGCRVKMGKDETMLTITRPAADK